MDKGILRVAFFYKSVFLYSFGGGVSALWMVI